MEELKDKEIIRWTELKATSKETARGCYGLLYLLSRSSNFFKLMGIPKDSGKECKLSKFADDSKMSDATDMLKGRGTIQMDLDRLEEWVLVNFMHVNKAKFKVLNMGQGNHQYQYSLGDG
ncbi:rna-directed dna polymerase from mobile element jockey-like [Limosa lapponica baueri]|uniref:Rna-directed dna polymerase from mobile element jockey-like n=1 Tax=Limosa lapponica baueri TaxID=1758121 RepID=A0A2I0URF1_LIMLA|nr:rna-directed dna polymerase from mobile element jockey-like [Limosa lapponica baueri]